MAPGMYTLVLQGKHTAVGSDADTVR